MYITVNDEMFLDAFKDDNGDFKGGFTYEGLQELFAFLTENEELNDQEEGSNPGYELDVIELMASWTEHESIAAACDDTGMTYDELLHKCVLLEVNPIYGTSKRCLVLQF